jgi:hypothetical protein
LVKTRGVDGESYFLVYIDNISLDAGIDCVAMEI